MKIDTNTIVSISDENQNFSKVARLVDHYGSAVILKNVDEMTTAPDEDVLAVSKKLMAQNKAVYEELAK